MVLSAFIDQHSGGNSVSEVANEVVELAVASEPVEVTDPNIPFTKMSIRDERLRQIFDNLCAAFKPSIVCDIGAFNGDESWRFAHLLPESKVVAFEASPQNYKQFYVENDRFKSVPNFRVNHKAVANYNGEISFNVLDAEDTSADWRRAANSIMSRTDGNTSKQVTVPCTTLDSYFGTYAIQDNTFAMWLDVEGALDKVLAGAPEVLSKTLFLRAEVEWKELWAGQVLAPEMKQLIEGYGFQLLGDSYIPNGYDQSDVVFVNKKLLDILAG
jgi:FkbM family methyltransferase